MSGLKSLVNKGFDRQVWENGTNETARCLRTERPLTHLIDRSDRQDEMNATTDAAVHERDLRIWRHLQNPSVVARFQRKVPPPTADGCQLWQGSLLSYSGYGRFHLSTGRRATESVIAHRVSLILARGLPPADALVAAHACRNRHCVAPAHLRWATTAENAADRRRDGTVIYTRGEAHALHVLTEDQVIEIRTLYAAGGVTQRELASRFGVVQSAISNIIQLRRWQHTRDLEDAK